MSYRVDEQFRNAVSDNVGGRRYLMRGGGEGAEPKALSSSPEKFYVKPPDDIKSLFPWDPNLKLPYGDGVLFTLEASYVPPKGTNFDPASVIGFRSDDAYIDVVVKDRHRFLHLRTNTAGILMGTLDAVKVGGLRDAFFLGRLTKLHLSSYQVAEDGYTPVFSRDCTIVAMDDGAL